MGRGVLSSGPGRDDGLGLLLGQPLSEVVGVVALVGEQFAEGPGPVDELVGHGNVGQVAGAEQQDAGTTLLVHQGVDLGGAPAPGAAYAVNEGPPFAPAAER